DQRSERQQDDPRVQAIGRGAPERVEQVFHGNEDTSGRQPAVCRNMALVHSSSPPRIPPSNPPAPKPPSTEPSSREPPRCGAAANTREARRENGRLCSHTGPGPVSLAKNRP